MTTPKSDRIVIDSDTHVIEPPDLFTSRLSTRHGALVPHVKYRSDVDQDWWFVGDTPIKDAVHGVAELRSDGAEGYERPQRYHEQHPSRSDPPARAKVMDDYGIRSAVMYPSLGLTGPDVYLTIPRAQLDFQLEVVSAYNDWVLSWPETEPGRFIPLACVPYWDIDGAVREIERGAARGMKGIIMTGKPEKHGCPILADRHWEPMWDAAEANRQTVSFHVASGGLEDSASPERRAALGQGLSVYLTTAEFLTNAIVGVDLVTSGVLQRHPGLNFVLVETGVGWSPFALEAMDEHYRRYKPWETQSEMRESELPSDLFRRQVYVNVWFERARRDLSYDNVMFETDFPHGTCLMGDEIDDAIDNRLASLSTEEKEGVLHKNAMRCFHLSPEDIGSP